MSEITVLLQQSRQGDTAAGERLYALLYDELRRLARVHLHRAGQRTLEPAALIHEAWLRGEGSGSTAVNRQQFFAYASAVMRSVIVDHVRASAAAKRGGGHGELTLSTGALEAVPDPAGEGLDAQAIEDALQALGRVDARALKVVEMRYFGGLTLEEIAEATELSVPTLKRDWQRARAFLFEQLGA
ncbi:ECF-type sigma factor [Pelomonas sp. KK5]|uniref:ECF-type sigma factor n=1 Tax=Pelomonas sp. KK5 TaxID=1855730 RepID=UPI00097C4BDD|nr:ECF-type sigma factor [Pelomonas sp. KK5]